MTIAILKTQGASHSPNMDSRAYAQIPSFVREQGATKHGGEKMVVCQVCGEELSEHNPGVDNWMEDGEEANQTFIVREMICDNEDCPLYEKQQDWFYDFTRIDVDGDEIDVELWDNLNSIKTNK